jgi:hypothetical protein
MASSCHNVDVLGKPTATGTIQGFAPINKIHEHLCAFHFYADDMTRQVEAHHFCSHLTEDFRQCIVFDGPGADARLIGVEYLAAEKVFLSLPDEEKPLWHSHEFEVKSGVLFMPGLTGRRGLEDVCRTYGKTYHFWQVDRGDALPLGLPQLMMALTRDGQLLQDMAERAFPCALDPPPACFIYLFLAFILSWGCVCAHAAVEKKFGVSFQKETEIRAYMSGPEHGIHPLANAAGKGFKTEIREVDLPATA